MNTTEEKLLALHEVSVAAAGMADRLKMLMEMHSRTSPEIAKHLGDRGIEEWGTQAHWWIKKLGEYFNNTDAVDPEDPRDQSWDVALETARKFFPLSSLEDSVLAAIQACPKTAQLVHLPMGGFEIVDHGKQLGTGETPARAWLDAASKI